MTVMLSLLLWLSQSLAAGSIQGVTVRAGTTQPLADVAIELRPLGLTAKSDASGNFAFPSVPAGRYTLVVDHDGFRLQIPAGLSPGQKLENITLRVNPPPSIFGTVYDPNGERLAAARVQAFQLFYSPYGQRLRSVKAGLTDDFGDYRLFWVGPGEYYVAASYTERDQRSAITGLLLSPNLTKPDDGYASVYFGGGFTPYESQKVMAEAGRDVSNVNMYFKEGPRFTVSGQLFVGCARIALVPEGGLLNEDTDFSVQACDSFQIRGVSPGTYVLLAAGPKTASDLVRVSVANKDVSGLRVTLLPTTDLRGQVNVDGRRSNSNLQQVQVSLIRRSREIDQRIQGAINSDGSFAIPDVGTGDYEVLLQPQPEGLFTRNIRFGARDVLMNGIRVDSGLRGLLDITLSSSGGSAEGSVTDRSGQAVAGAQVVLVPAAFRNRQDRYKTATADLSGNFQISGVPAGLYTALAFEGIEPGAYYAFAYDQPLYTRYASKGVSATFNELGRQSMSLIAIPADQTSGGLR